MFNIKKYNFRSGYAAFLTGLFLSFLSSGVLACGPRGHIDFHNYSTVPLKIVIKTVPHSVVHCVVPYSKYRGLKKKGCDSEKIKYVEYTINVPAKKGEKMGKQDGVCISNGGRYMVSYRTLIDDYKQPFAGGPDAHLKWLERNSGALKFRLKHGGDHSHITASGCFSGLISSNCVVRFYKVL